MAKKKKYQQSVAIDLDGTLAQYDGWKGVKIIGDPFEGAVEFTHKLKEMGLRVIIHTARISSTDNPGSESAIFVERWLEKHGFKYDELWWKIGKPIACAYVDDRAVECQPMKSPDLAYEYTLMQIRDLAREEK